MYGLRPIPLAGRQGERRKLWAALAEVARERRPRAIVVRGRAGYGKTRLVEWLSELAAERGAARVFWVHHEPSTTSDGVTRMIEQHLRTDGLSDAERAERIGRVLPDLGELERAQLTMLLAKTGAPTLPAERYAIAHDLLVHRTSDRPALLVFDDAQHGPDSILFVEHLLRRADAPLLAILCLREEWMEEHREIDLELASLMRRPRAQELVLGPLGDVEHAKLIEDLLGLSPALAARVAVRTTGSPLFAVQLVGDWVQRGYLVASERGFALREGEEPDIPDDIHALWSARIERLVASSDDPDNAERALAMMALLGRQLVRDEWEGACREAAIEPPEGLLDAMAVRRLAFVGRARLTLVHGMLQESLERRAREHGAWGALHAACARMLEARYPGERAYAERRARHLVEAGELEAALSALLTAAQVRLSFCDFNEARQLCARYALVLDGLGAPSNDLRRARGWILEGEISGTQGQLDESERGLARAEPIVRRAEEPRLFARLLTLRGGNCLKRVELSQAVSLFRESLALLHETNDSAGRAMCFRGLAEAEKVLGKLDESAEHYRAASASARAAGDPLGEGRSRLGLADLHRRRGEFDVAIAMLEDVVDLMRRLGNRYSLGVALNSLGDIMRNRGELAGAERCYAEVLRVFDSIASEDATIVRLNLGLVLLARAEHARARRTFEAARPELGERGREGFLVFSIAGELASAAGLGDFEALSALHEELVRVLDRVAIVDDDLASVLEMAAASSQSAHPAWARRFYELALAQWEGVGRADAASALRSKIGAL